MLTFVDGAGSGSSADEPAESAAREIVAEPALIPAMCWPTGPYAKSPYFIAPKRATVVSADHAKK